MRGRNEIFLVSITTELLNVFLNSSCPTMRIMGALSFASVAIASEPLSPLDPYHLAVCIASLADTPRPWRSDALAYFENQLEVIANFYEVPTDKVQFWLDAKANDLVALVTDDSHGRDNGFAFAKTLDILNILKISQADRRDFGLRSGLCSALRSQASPIASLLPSRITQSQDSDVETLEEFCPEIFTENLLWKRAKTIRSLARVPQGDGLVLTVRKETSWADAVPILRGPVESLRKSHS